MEKKKIEDFGVLTLFGDITSSSVEEIFRSIISLNLNNPNLDHIKLFINSRGGDLRSSFALTDMMEMSHIPVHTIGLGLVASAGLNIFIAGKHRILTPQTSILSHQLSAGIYNKEHELVSYMTKEVTNMRNRLLHHYKRFTTVDTDIIENKLLGPTDYWLDAKEALKYGMCDEVKLIKNINDNDVNKKSKPSKTTNKKKPLSAPIKKSAP